MSGFVNPLGRKPKPGYLEAIDQIKARTCELLALGDGVVVSVTELRCCDPGCPDIETVVAILAAGQEPQTFRFHKPIPDVNAADLAEAFAPRPALRP